MAVLSSPCGPGVKCENLFALWNPCQRRSGNCLNTTVTCTKNWLWTLFYAGKKRPILTRFCGAQNLSYKKGKTNKNKSRKCPTVRRDGSGVTKKRNFRGQSCLGSLSQVEALPGTSCRWCRSGGCRRTAEPARRLGCCPAASQSTSTRCLLSRRTGRCSRCWSEERRVVGLFHIFSRPL